MNGDPLRVVSCQAPNGEFVYREMAAFIERETGISTRYVDDVPWQRRYEMLASGEAGIGVVCGLPYVRQADRPEAAYRPIAAPVMAAERYEGRPVYFSDVVVRASSGFRSFDDLRGARWVYNEPGSHSGFGVVGYELARRGLDYGYFGEVTESGAHQRSIELLLAGEVDASAIDSTVLDLELALRPELAGELRTVESFGPSPMPPIVASLDLPEETVEILRAALLRMHEDAEAGTVLERGLVARIVAVDDGDYDEIRRMAAVAGEAGLLDVPA